MGLPPVWWLMAQPGRRWRCPCICKEHPIAHFLHFSPGKRTLVWTVNLLNETVRQSVSPLLTSVKEISLYELTLPVTEVRVSPAVSAAELIRFGRSYGENRAKLVFLSPCAFKQSGRYAIFPQETLLLQSLTAHWNAAFPEYALTDDDALLALQQGLHIVDYNLRTTRYPLKETRIPSFQGSVTVEAHLAPPLLELWNALLSFAPYGGVGIKTTLVWAAQSVPSGAPVRHKSTVYRKKGKWPTATTFL